MDLSQHEEAQLFIVFLMSITATRVLVKP